MDANRRNTVMAEKEIWKSHPDIAGIEVSTFGNVRTLDRVVSSEKATRFVKGHVLKQFSSKGGYLRVSVQGNRKVVKKLVHRLVAQTYIPNPDNLPEINHKDCNSANNNGNGNRNLEISPRNCRN